MAKQSKNNRQGKGGVNTKPMQQTTPPFTPPDTENQVVSKPTLPKNKLVMLAKMLVVAVVVIGVVRWTDEKRWFAPNESGAHNEKRWESFYDIKDTVPIDVLVLGTSRVHCGLSPSAMSLSLGNVCFAMAQSGQPMACSYFALEEMLDNCNPKLVCVETNGLRQHDFDEETPDRISFIARDFKGRRDIVKKLKSMPVIFSSDYWPQAWSESIKNHDYFFRDTARLNANKRGEVAEFKTDEKLYLGRFVRFTTGISDSVMKLYDANGAPSDGTEMTIGEEADLYAKKIVKLCEKKGVEVMFFTIPVFHRHIKNAEARCERLDSFVHSLGKRHFDMQAQYDTSIFTKDCFEDTYLPNQHGTKYGSIVFAYRLARYIHDSLRIELPKRDDSPRFHSWFCDEDQYVYNYPPQENDTAMFNVRMAEKVKDTPLISAFYKLGESSNRMFVKLKRAVGDSLPQQNVVIHIDGRYKGQRTIAKVDINRFHDVVPVRHELYGVNLIKEFEIDSIVGMEKK